MDENAPDLHGHMMQMITGVTPLVRGARFISVKATPTNTPMMVIEAAGG